MGDQCEIRMLLTSRVGKVFTSNRIFTVTHLVCYNLYEIIISFLSSAVCSQTCQNEGICSAPNTCDCSGTGYMGDQCEIRMLLRSRVGQVFSTDRVFTVTHLVYYNLCEIIISFLSSAVCSQTCQNEGICSAPNTCDCSGTGYMGDQCEIRMLLRSRVGQVFSTDRVFTVTHLVYYNLCEIIISFLSSAVCSQTCQNEGICSAPNTCDCSGTGYMGDQCEIRMLLTSRVGKVFTSNRIFAVTHLVYYEIIICFLSSAVCSQTCQNEGICSAPNTCDCFGTGYMGDQCEIRMLLTSTVGQVFSTDRVFTVTYFGVL